MREFGKYGLVIVFYLLLGNSWAQQVKVESPVRFLALGDSYTIGQSVPIEDRWPEQLAKRLQTWGVEVEKLSIIAQTGWTTRQLIRGIELQNPQGTYDLVSLLIGVNNQYRKQDTATYRTEFRELLHMAIAFADDKPTHVIVVV